MDLLAGEGFDLVRLFHFFVGGDQEPDYLVFLFHWKHEKFDLYEISVLLFQKNVLAWWVFLADQSFFNLLQVEASWDEEAKMERAIGILVINEIFEDI